MGGIGKALQSRETAARRKLTLFLPNNLHRHRYVCIVVFIETHYSVMKGRRMVDE
jgi:hypothetical protein